MDALYNFIHNAAYTCILFIDFVEAEDALVTNDNSAYQMHHAPLSFIESQENTAYSSMHVNSVACASPDYEEITNLPAKKGQLQ